MGETGTGTVILNAVNTYSGGTKISSGTVTVGTAATTGASPTPAIVGTLGTGAVSISGGGTLDLVHIGTTTNNPFALSVSNLVAGTGTLEIDSADTNTISGTLTDSGSGKLALTVNGSGITVLTNNGNNYRGNFASETPRRAAAAPWKSAPVP